jgi:hypothetical protein
MVAPIGKAISAARIWSGEGRKARIAASRTRLEITPAAVRPTLLGALIGSPITGGRIDQVRLHSKQVEDRAISSDLGQKCDKPSVLSAILVEERPIPLARRFANKSVKAER